MDMDDTEKITAAYGGALPGAWSGASNVVFGTTKAASQTYNAANLFAGNSVKL
jgi:hypothetical protein